MIAPDSRLRLFYACCNSRLDFLRLLGGDGELVAIAKFIQFNREPMAERTLGPQLIEQLLGAIEGIFHDLATFEHPTPATRHLVLG